MAKQIVAEQYTLINGDCIEACRQLPDETVGFSLFSPPFCDLYSYSDHPADMGNAKSYAEFFEHFGFLVEQLYRLTLPGRVCAVHCMDLPTHKRSGEEIGLRDFPGDIIRCYQEHGWTYHSRFVVWKDPLVAATRTKAIGLAHKQIVKDSSMCRTGIPDYILAFRKPGANPVPVSHKDGLTTYHGSRPVPGGLNGFLAAKDQSKNKRSHWIWQQYASPVWMDIRQTRVLPYREGREHDDEKHICPLQLDAVERCIELWSAPGDVVLEPFMGVGTVPYVAVKNGRKAIGVELKASYFKQAVRNVRQAIQAGIHTPA